MSGAHAFLPPSAADAWVVCALWASMNEAYPKPDSEASLSGSAAHWSMAQELGLQETVHGQVTDDGYVLTQELIDNARVFVRDVRQRLHDQHAYVEVRMPPGTIHPRNWGTPDTYAFIELPGGRYLLVLWDFKNGHGFVPVIRNWQLTNYVRLILDRHGFADEVVDVEFRIVQPNNYDASGPIRVWNTTAVELRAAWQELRGAAARACGPNPLATVNPQCIHCPGRLHCSTLTRVSSHIVDVTMEPTPFNLPAERLGHELRQLRAAQAVLDARVSGLEDEARALWERGERGFGFVIERTLGARKWKAESPAVIELGKLYNLDLAKVSSLTPAQAIKAGIPEPIVKRYSERTGGTPKLVPFDQSQAHSAFFKGK